MKIAEFQTEGSYQAFFPSPKLRSYIKEYWIFDLNNTAADNTRELIQPNLFPEVIFKMGCDYENYSLIQNKTSIIKGGIVSGIQNRAIASKRVNPNERLLLIGVKFDYIGLYQLLKRPLSDLYNLRIPLSSISSEILIQLESLLNEAKSNEEIIAILNKEFLAYYGKNDHLNEISSLIKVINSHDITNLKNLMEQTGKNYKFLERRFKKYLGVTPKKYFNLKRYLLFYNYWIEHNNYKYIDLVYDLNYYDQNHLIKDFKSVLNMSPNHFRNSKANFFTEHILRNRLNQTSHQAISNDLI